MSGQERKSVILKSKPTTCSVDPILTSLLFDCLDDLLPALSQIVNDSLLCGSFPSVFKHAVVKSLLRKSTLDHNNLKNYRPVSNPSFLSRVIEKIVLLELFACLNYFPWPAVPFRLLIPSTTQHGDDSAQND